MGNDEVLGLVFDLPEAEFLLLLVAWFVLLALSWPLVLLALALVPVNLVVAWPFLLLGITIRALLTVLTQLLFLPARILGYRG